MTHVKFLLLHRRGVRGAMFSVIINGHGDTSSNP